MHGRYYSFALPLLPICAVIVLDRYHSQLVLKRPLVSGIILAAIFGLVAFTASATLGPFQQSFAVVDFPDPYFLRQPWLRLMSSHRKYGTACALPADQLGMNRETLVQ